ncbi:hypothetical protein JYU34_015114 [Plutella xylostella]|uniref:MADF domain-containing protein n=1 Tax=Plutella xylostella TaxID=51655 RepID=A0ABQ7Q7T4_PLUXY|nr:hypothetical protein JYU34_015114 [Plutella xylostella]
MLELSSKCSSMRSTCASVLELPSARVAAAYRPRSVCRSEKTVLDERLLLRAGVCPNIKRHSSAAAARGLPRYDWTIAARGSRELPAARDDRRERPLWDTRRKEYHNNNVREDLWDEIAKTFVQPKAALKLKMKSLLSSYRRERNREKTSNVTGCGRNEAYKSKWFAYEAFSFLHDRNNPIDAVVSTYFFYIFFRL